MGRGDGSFVNPKFTGEHCRASVEGGMIDVLTNCCGERPACVCVRVQASLSLSATACGITWRCSAATPTPLVRCDTA
jgi:hypothetical protein